MAMEDFRVDVVVGKGPGATAIPLELPPFTLVGATTRAGLLPRRCATASVSPRTWSSTNRPSWNASSTARRAARRRDRHRRRRRDRRPLPRHPPHRQPPAAPRPRLRPGQGRRRDHAGDRRGRPRGVRGGRPRPGPAGPRGPPGPAEAVRRGPVGLSTLAVAVGEERETVEEVAEPFLVREGLLARTPVAGSPRPRHGRISASPRPAPGAGKRTTGPVRGVTPRPRRAHWPDQELRCHAERCSMRADSLRLRRCRLCRRCTTAAFAGGARHPQPSGRSPSRSCEGSTDP